MKDQFPKALYRVTSKGIEKLVRFTTNYDIVNYVEEGRADPLNDVKPDFQARDFNADSALLSNPYRLQLEKIYLTREDAEEARLKLNLPSVDPAKLYLKNLSEQELDELRLDFDTISDKHLESIFLQALKINSDFPTEMAMRHTGQINAYVNANIRLRSSLRSLYEAVWRECEARGIYLYKFYGEVGSNYENIECTVEPEYAHHSDRHEWLDFRLKTIEGNALLNQRFSSRTTKPRPGFDHYRIGDRILVDFTVQSHDSKVINEYGYDRDMLVTPARLTNVQINQTRNKVPG